MKTKTGFTLVEIIITVAIIGILAAIIIATLQPQRQRARDSSVRATVHSAATAATICSTDSQAIADPASNIGNPICATNVATWPDLVESDPAASWGGCSFSQNVLLTTFTFCATLGSGTVVTCTEVGCTSP